MEPFKNLYSPELVECIADHLGRHLVNFDRGRFIELIVTQLDTLELKERVQHIADVLHSTLPTDPERRADLLLALLHPKPLPNLMASSDSQGLRGWAIMPLTMVVGQHGIGDFDRSLSLLREMTKQFSAEFGIRYFLLADQSRTLSTLAQWVQDPDPHVRRLVSEGTRPRLPWAMRLPKLIADPSPVLPLLTALRDDPEDYVRRSVANHLNDIAKDHPRLIASLIRKWLIGADRNRRALLRHAARSLIKIGDIETLDAFGYHPSQLAHAVPELESKSVQMGAALAFSLMLKSVSATPQKLVVDYVIHFRKANGTLSQKVFKGSVLTLLPQESRLFHRRHLFQEVTTRAHYFGLHRLGFRINGCDTEAVDFELLESSK